MRRLNCASFPPKFAVAASGEPGARRPAEALEVVIDWLILSRHRLLHSTLGYFSTMEFEENWHTGPPRQAAQSGDGLR